MSERRNRNHTLQRPGPVMLDVLDSLERVHPLPLSLDEFAEDTGRRQSDLRDALYRLRLRRLVRVNELGTFELTEYTSWRDAAREAAS